MAGATPAAEEDAGGGAITCSIAVDGRGLKLRTFGAYAIARCEASLGGGF